MGTKSRKPICSRHNLSPSSPSPKGYLEVVNLGWGLSVGAFQSSASLQVLLPLARPAKPPAGATTITGLLCARRPGWLAGGIVCVSGSWHRMLAVIRRRILYYAALLLVPLLRKTVVNDSFLLSVFNSRKVMSSSLLLDGLSTLLAQMLFQDDSISGVALVHSICNVTNEGNQADEEVDDHVDQHHHAQTGWESTIDLLAVSHDHQGKRGVSGVSDAIEGQFVSCWYLCEHSGVETYKGTRPMTLPQPKRTPHRLNRA